MAQKTIDFENDILGPIGSLKEDIIDLKDNKITKFYTNNNGDTVLNDSDDGKIQDLVIYGKSEQAQYEGINLLNYKKETETANGIAFTYDKKNQVYKVNGTSTEQVNKIIFEKAENIYVGKKIVCCPSGGQSSTYSIVISYFDGAGVWKDESYDIGYGQTIKDYPKLSISILVRDGVTVNNLVFKPMIVEDTTKTYDDFEPYTGGKPSPSPEYPQEIKAVVNPVIKTYGKNLLKVTFQYKIQDGVTCTNNGDGTYTLNGTATRQTDFILFGKYDSTVRIPTDIRKTYIIKKSGNSNIQFHVGVANKYTVTCSTEDGLIENKAGISYFICRILSGATLNNFTIYPQIEEGSVSTDFKPYQESQDTLHYELYAIPVSSGGNVTIDGQQYIADYVDVERKKLVRMVKKNNISFGYVVDSLTDTKMIVSSEILNRKNADSNVICNAGRYAYPIFGLDKAGYISWYGSNMNSIAVRVPISMTSNEFNSLGVYVIYELATPTEIDLTDEEVQAFKALSTYYPKTYINAESEQLEAYTMFNYPVSMEKGWEYVKQQIGDTRKYVYDMDLQSAEAYVNSEYAVALTELEV